MANERQQVLAAWSAAPSEPVLSALRKLGPRLGSEISTSFSVSTIRGPHNKPIPHHAGRFHDNAAQISHASMRTP
jgi:hypothetical protein